MKYFILILVLTLTVSCGGSPVQTPTPDSVSDPTAPPTLMLPTPTNLAPEITDECKYIREVLTYLQQNTKAVKDQVYAEQLGDVGQYQQNASTFKSIASEVSGISVPPKMAPVHAAVLEAVSFTSSSQYLEYVQDGKVNDYLVGKYTVLIDNAQPKIEAAIALYCPQ